MIEELRNKFTKFNQEHLLDFFDELNDEEKNLLIQDLKSIDFERVSQLFEEVFLKTDQNDQHQISSELKPLNDDVYQSTVDLSIEKKDFYRQIGKR